MAKASDKSEAESWRRLALALLMLFVVCPLGVLLTGWSLSYSWNVLAAPMFGLPMATMAQAITVAFFVVWLTQKHAKDEREQEEKMVGMILGPLVHAGVAWVLSKILL